MVVKIMVFGLSEKQKQIMAYLYELKDTPQKPPDPRLSVSLIARNLGITQREVREEVKGLIKRRYVGSLVIERERHYFLVPRGIREMEKFEEKLTEFEISTEKIGIKKKKREIVG